jgi:Overcoming lysogenization defect protein-like, TOPRIM domain
MAYDERTLVTSETTREPADPAIPRGVILVEGVSDQLALEALARRRGRNLEAEGITIVPMGGATNIRRFLDVYGPNGFDMRLAGLYDAGEEGDFKRALEREGFGADLARTDMERHGFYACEADLEEELIRALGAAAVERVIDAQDELTSLRSLQNQPAWRGRKVEEQLRRFFGSKGSRKSRFGALLIEALDLTQVPRPLDRVLAHL